MDALKIYPQKISKEDLEKGVIGNIVIEGVVAMPKYYYKFISAPDLKTCKCHKKYAYESRCESCLKHPDNCKICNPHAGEIVRE